jgi:hypothetical protein
VNSDRIGAAWREYRTKVIPLNASAIQAKESRRAFYAGANAMLVSILGMLDPGNEVTANDLAGMDALQAELEHFAREILAGRA